jgi:hypothetical protein
MLDSFEDSVLAAADSDGKLTSADADKLCFDHGCQLAAYVVDTGDLSQDAYGLLSWLGY